MLKRIKYRLYPTPQQAELINKHIGSCRLIYNLALETKQMAYISNHVNLSCFDLMKQLPELKKEYIWLNEVNSQSLQQAIINLDMAYTRFFKGQANYPKFKKKLSKGSFSVPQNIIVDYDNSKLIFPKFKRNGINIVLHRGINGIIRNVTIKKASTGKYFASILVDDGIKIPKKKSIKENSTIGIDLGINSFLVASSGIKFENPKNLKKELSKLRYTHRKYSKYKGKRTKKKLAIIHEKVTNRRKDFLHKTSTTLIKNHDSIAIEDLNIKGMLKNHYLAQSISDVSWGMFVEMLKYKAEWYGKNILEIGRFDPSSKTCSNCGTVNKNLTLKDRDWICNNCGVNHNRDINASINIKTFALKKQLSVGHRHKNRNELPALVGVMTSEIHKIKSNE